MADNLGKTCRICFTVNENTVVNQISPLHIRMIEKVINQKFLMEPSMPDKICKECLSRLLDANYFCILITEANTHYSNLTKVTDSEKLEASKEEKLTPVKVEEAPVVIQITETINLEEDVATSTFGCCMCDTYWVTEEEALDHCRNTHKSETLVGDEQPGYHLCRLCCIQFESEEDCANHKTCENCFESFFTDADLREHCEAVHDFTPSQTTEIIFETTEFQESHDVEPETKFGCCLCPTLLQNEQERAAHYFQRHSVTIKSPRALKEGRPDCLYCGQTFSGITAYRNHFVAPSKGSPKKKDTTKTVLNDTKYFCTLCNIQLKSASAYYSHNHRLHGNKSRYICDICQKSCITPSKLQEHINTHNNVKPFPCNMCEKSFFRKDNLKNHQRVHSGEKKFPCDFCQKSFGYLTDKKRHEWAHHIGHYPHKCEKCGKGFIKASALNIHMKSCKKNKTPPKSKRMVELVVVGEYEEQANFTL